MVHVHQVLEEFNNARKHVLDSQKTERFRKRRIHLKVERTKDAQRRKVWSHKHGHDTYGDQDSGDQGSGDEDSREFKPKVSRKKGSFDGKCKACGSTTHLRSSHKDYPFNKRLKDSTSHVDDGATSVNSDAIPMLSDEESSSDDFILSSDSDHCFDDDIFTGDLCTCGAGGRAHKKDCPMSSRNHYNASRVLFPGDPCADPIPPPTDTTGGSDIIDTTKSINPGSSVLSKRENVSGDQPPPAKKQRSIRSEIKCVFILTGWISSMFLTVWYLYWIKNTSFTATRVSSDVVMLVRN